LWCPGAELNHRHLHFQCSALPTELPGRRTRRTAGGRARGVIKARFPAVQTSRRGCGRHTIRPEMPHAPAAFVSSPGSSARSWTTCAGTLARYLGRPVPRSRRKGDRMNRCDAASPRSRNGGDFKYISRSRIRHEYNVDYEAGWCYHSNIPLTRGVSGDDPEGGAGCGVDRGW
jgi:hypothetical protein